MKKLADGYRTALFTGEIDWTAGPIWMALCDLGVLAPLVSMEFRDEVTTGVVAEAVLPGFVATAGGLTVPDGVLPSVTGASCEQIVLYHFTGTQSTSRLLYWNDDFPAVVPNGEDIDVLWPNGVLDAGQL